MADKTVKVKVDVETDVEPSLAALRALKKQLKETAAGSEEFIALQRQIDDVQDSLVAARAGAGNFADVLGALPGPIGAIGGQLGGTLSTLKQFSAVQFTNIQASFVELGNDLTDIAKGFFNLTGITKVYTVLNTALAKSFVAVGIGETAAAAGAKAFAAALTATGIGALVVGLGLLIANWDKVVDAIKGATAESKTYEEAQSKVTEGLTDFNKKLIEVENSFEAARTGTISKKDALKLYNDTLGKTVGFAGSLEEAEQLLAENTAVVVEGIKLRTQANVFYAKSAEAAAKAVSGEGVEPTFWQSVGDYIQSGGQLLQFYNRQTETYVKNLQETNKNVDVFAKEGDKLTQLAIENDKKLKKGLETPPNFEDTTKAVAAALDEIKKAQEEARLSLLGDEARELEQVKIKYDKLIASAKKYKQDTKVLEQSREKENSEIVSKFAKQQKDNAEKDAKELLDARKRAIDDSLSLEEQFLNLRLVKGEIGEKEFQNKLFEIRKNAAIQNELLTNENLQKEQKDLSDKYSSGLLTLEDYTNKKNEIEVAALQKNKEFISAQIELEKFSIEQKKLNAEEERSIALTSLQQRLEDLDRENQLSDFDFQQDLERLAEQRTILAEQEAIELQNTELTEFQKTEITKKYADARKAITDEEVATERAAMMAKQEINLAYLGLFEQFGSLLGQIAGKNKALAISGIIIQQAAAIGQIIANTAIANAKAVAALPLVGGMPFVAINTISAGLSIASTIAAAAKSVQQINSQPGAPASNAGSAGGGGAQISAPRVAGAAAPQINTTGGMNPTQQIGETLGAAQKPIRAYVVSGDVSSQQALDRRTSRAATFTGG
jgi:LmbE family N-acetylglucosaminyl deacetylase